MISADTRQRLDPYIRRATGGRLYYAYGLDGEHVGTFPTGVVLSPQHWVVILIREGYEPTPTLGPIPLEAAKTRRGDTRTHDISLRRIDPDNPRRQWHLHGWIESDGLNLHSHYEYRPDLRPVAGETWGEAIDRAREHLKPSWGTEWGDGTTYLPGDACPVVRRMLQS